MTLPHQEHNSLLVTREFLIILLNEDKLVNDSEKIRLSVKSILKHYPTRERLDEVYKGNTIMDSPSNSESEFNINSNKMINNNQTWDTPGYKWKTEVEFIKNE